MSRIAGPACLGLGVKQRVLITGGARSGKSTAAESRLSGFPNVRYVATSVYDGTDTEWTARVRAHQRRRPTTWSTVETTDLIGQIELASPEHPVLIDCLTVWLARRLDELSTWRSDEPVPVPVPVPVPGTEPVRVPGTAPAPESVPQLPTGSTSPDVELEPEPDPGLDLDPEPDLVPALIRREITELTDAIRRCSGGLVIVTNEVGSGIVPATVSGRQFRDLMGSCNAAVAQACDELVLVVAGCELRIKGAG